MDTIYLDFTIQIGRNSKLKYEFTGDPCDVVNLIGGISLAVVNNAGNIAKAINAVEESIKDAKSEKDEKKDEE